MNPEPVGPTAMETDGAMVEGLFVRALKLDGAIAEELKALGIDLTRLKPKYPRQTFLRALDRVAGHVYPTLPRDKAIFQLGRKSVDGFLQTLLGKIVSVGVRLGGPDRVMAKTPKHVQTGDSKYDRIKVEKLGNAHWRLDVSDPAAIPEYFAGMTEGWLNQTGVVPTIRIQETGPGAFSLTVRWGARS